MGPLNRRTKLIIMPDVQYGLLGYIAAFVALMALSQFTAFVLFLKYALTATSLDEGSASTAIYAAILEQRFVLLAYLLIPILVVSAVGIYFFVRLSNRIAGPIFNVHRQIRDANASGKPLKIVLRQGDYFQDLARDLNRLADTRMQDPAPNP